jgi:hypothetical protein
MGLKSVNVSCILCFSHFRFKHIFRKRILSEFAPDEIYFSNYIRSMCVLKRLIPLIQDGAEQTYVFQIDSV